MESSPIADRPRPNWRAVVVDLALLAAALVAAYWKVIFAGQIFQVTNNVDWSYLTQPAYEFTGKALARGEFPLWNTHWLAGFPHFAVPSNGMLYPTTVLFGMMSFAVAIKIVSLAHVYLFAALSYWLGRDMFGARAPSLYLGFCGIIGSLITWGLRGGHIWTLMTIAWMPFAFLCLRRILHSGRIKWALILAPVLGLMFLAGDPQTMSFVYLWFGGFTAATLAIRLVSRADSPNLVLRKGLLCTAAVAVGIGLAAVQLLPSQELMEQSIRGHGVNYRFLMGDWRTDTEFTFGEYEREYRKGLLFETVPTHIVVPAKVTFALILVAFVGAGYREVLALFAAFMFCQLYSNLPLGLYESVVRHIPVYNSMRGTIRAMGMLIFLAHVLAAHGLNTLLQSNDRSALGRARWIAAAVVASGLCATSLRFDAQYLAPTSLTVLAFTLVAISAVRRAWLARELAVALLVIASIELIPHFTRDVDFETDAVFAVTPDYQKFSESRNSVDRVHIVDPIYGRIVHATGVGLLTGDRLIEGSHALYLRRYSDLYDVFTGMSISTHDERGVLQTQGPYVGEWITPNSFILFDLLNVRYIVRYGAPVPLLERAVQLWPSSYSVSRVGELYVYENRRALPPLFPVHEAVPVAGSKAALEMIRSGEVDYRRQATVPEGTEIPVLAPAEVIEPIMLKKYGPDTIEATVTLAAPALLVLSEMWYPDWYAQVDDGPAQRTICVDGAIQGTSVPAGEHEVRFFYRPSSFVRGMVVTALTAAAWIACVAAAIVHGRRRRARDGLESVPGADSAIGSGESGTQLSGE